MKRLILLIFLIPLLSGIDFNSSAPSTRPIKGQFFSIADLTNTPPVQCKPVQIGVQYAFGMGWLGGNVSHLGKVNLEMSPFWVNSCNFGPGPTEVTWAINGRVTGANGDQYFYTGMLVLDGVTSTMTGTIYINGGTGRFKEAVGEAELVGFINSDNSAQFTTNGWITY